MNNTLIVIGNLVKDPEIKYLDSGKSVTNFTLAVNDFVNGEKQVTYINCQLWENEFVAEKCKKGNKLICQGTLTKQEYKKDGNTKTKYVMNVYKVAFDNAYLSVSGEITEVENQEKCQVLKLKDSDLTIINYTKTKAEETQKAYVIGTLSMVENKPYLNVIKIDAMDEMSF